jgi:hypothetical protein
VKGTLAHLAGKKSVAGEHLRNLAARERRSDVAAELLRRAELVEAGELSGEEDEPDAET